MKKIMSCLTNLYDRCGGKCLTRLLALADPKKKNIMNNDTKRFVAIIGIGSALMMPIKKMFADSDSEFFPKLSAEWLLWSPG
jgi:hypothetical protein